MPQISIGQIGFALTVGIRTRLSNVGNVRKLYVVVVFVNSKMGLSLMLVMTVVEVLVR